MRNPRLNAILNWSTKVGTLFGVPIRLHITIVFFLWAALARNGLGFWLEVEYAIGIVLCILLHELGHALSAKKYKLTGLSIMLHGFGGFAVSRGFRTPTQELVISLAGPAVTFVIGFICLVVGTVGRDATPFMSTPFLQFHVVHSLGVLNIWMGVLNLIPSMPFDGGHALAAILSHNRPEQKARRLVGHLGLVICPIMALYGLFTNQGFLTIFGLMGAFSSAAYLMNSGGIQFGEAMRDRRARQEEEAFKKRRQEQNAEYLGDVAARAREREEQERLRRLLE